MDQSIASETTRDTVTPDEPQVLTRRNQSQVLDEMRALARGISGDPALEVRVGERLRIDLASGIVELVMRHGMPLDHLRAGVCHEAGHRILTYQHEFLMADPNSPAREADEVVRCAVQDALNTVEDVRLERWLLRRFPGVRAWIEDFNRSVNLDRVAREADLFTQVLIAISQRWTPGLGELSPGLSEAAVTRMNGLVDAIQEYLGCTPAAGLDRLGLTLSSALPTWFNDAISPSGFGRAARRAALESYLVFRDRIWPALQDLAPQYRPRPSARDEAMASVAGEEDDALGVQDGSDHHDRERAVASLPSTYVQILDKVRAQVVPLSAALTRLLEPADQTIYSPAASGTKVSLSRAMAFEARPDAAAVFLRRRFELARRQRVKVLVDLSGSMRHQKIEVATAATVLVAEAAERAGLELAVEGFQDRLIPFKDFQQPLAIARGALATMPDEVAGTRVGGHNQPGYNNDGECLAASYEALRQAMAQGDRGLLVVLSDGLPEPSHHQKQREMELLRRTIAAVQHDPAVTLVGVGVGTGTGHVADFYGEAHANVPLTELTAVLATILRGALSRR